MLKQSVSVIRVKETAVQDLTQVSDRLREVHDLISRRAYEIFEANGGSFGHGLDHWLRAESELLHPVAIEIQDSDGELTVRAEVPGFKAHEIDVIVDPRRLTFVGKRESKNKRKVDKLIHSERGTARVLRVIDLPWMVDTERVTGTLKDGVWELTLPKAVAGNVAAAESRAA